MSRPSRRLWVWIAVVSLALTAAALACAPLDQGRYIVVQLTPEGFVPSPTPLPTGTPLPDATPTPAPQATALGTWEQEGIVYDFAASPNGNRIAIAAEAGLFMFRDRVWFDLTTSPPRSVAMSPDGTILLVGDANGQVSQLDGVTGEVLVTNAIHNGAAQVVVYSADGSRYATGGADGTVTIRDAETGGLQQSLAINGAVVNDLAWSADGSQLAAGGQFSNGPGVLTVWDANSGAELHGILLHAGANTLDWSPDADQIALGLQDSSLLLWQTETGYLRTFLPGASQDAEDATGIRSLVYGPNDAMAVAVNNTITLYHVPSKQIMHQVDVPADQPIKLAWSADQSALLAANATSGIASWDFFVGDTTVYADMVTPAPAPITLAEAYAFSELGANALAVDFFASGDVFAAGGSVDRLSTWALNGDGAVQFQRAVPGPAGAVTALAISPDDTLVASASGNGRILVWEAGGAEAGFIRATLQGHAGTVNALAFSPDGTTLASASDDSTVILWNIESQEIAHTLVGHNGVVTALSFSPDGATLTSGSTGNDIIVWDTASGTQQATLSDPESFVTTLAYSSDGSLLASGYAANVINIWDVSSGEVVRQLRGHINGINTLAFAPDSDTLASGDSGGTVILWDARHNELRFRLSSGEPTSSLGWSADGGLLAAGASNGAVTIWEVGQ